MRSLFIAIALTATGLGADHADVRRPASGNPIVVPQSTPEQDSNAVELSAHFECLGKQASYDARFAVPTGLERLSPTVAGRALSREQIDTAIADIRKMQTFDRVVFTCSASGYTFAFVRYEGAERGHEQIALVRGVF